MTRREPDRTFSRTKWKSKARCFIREWKIGLAERYVVPTLSQNTTGGCVRVIPSSYKNELTHFISAEMLATARYSASVDDRATSDCFLEDQAIGMEPMYRMNALVETKSYVSPA